MIRYDDVWSSMNELDMMTSKICYVMQMIDFTQEEIDNNQYDKAQMLLHVLSNYVDSYLKEYDVAFKHAWKTTIQAGRELDDARAKISRILNPENPQYTDEELEAMTNEITIKELLS